MRVTEQQALGLRDIGYVVIYPTDMNGNKFGTDKDYLPHIDSAIRWMREVKGVHVYADRSADKSQRYWAYTLQWIKTGYNMAQSCHIYPSHDLAQSAGLDAAIEYVKKQQQI